MIIIEKDNQEKQFCSFINNAVSLLADEKYQEFIDCFDESRMNVNELISALRYLDDNGPITQIDNPGQSNNNIRGVYKYTKGNGYAVDYDLMTNGKLNDLTLQIEFLIVDNKYKVCLEDLHTL